MNVTFTVDAYPARPFQGMVRQVRDNAQTTPERRHLRRRHRRRQRRAPAQAGHDRERHVRATRSATTRCALPNAALRFKPDAATLAAMLRRRADAAPPRADEPTSAPCWVLRGATAIAGRDARSA